jgi:hypothetical protein
VCEEGARERVVSGASAIGVVGCVLDMVFPCVVGVSSGCVCRPLWPNAGTVTQLPGARDSSKVRGGVPSETFGTPCPCCPQPETKIIQD